VPTRIAAEHWQHFIEDCEAGCITVHRANLARILSIATRLSVRYTAGRGHRSFDILHVAGALELGAKSFLTIDINQKMLAKSEGLLPPI
jgi:hypothetical protein